MMQTANLILSDGSHYRYTIRRSKRAKYLRMQLSADKGLIVTQPQGITTKAVEEWVNSKQDWLNKHLDKLQQQPSTDKAAKTLTLPDHINLTAIDQQIEVHYDPYPGTSELLIQPVTKDRLILCGNTTNTALCARALQKWLQQLGKYHLGQQLQTLSQETGYRYQSYRVKGQKSRWGSCSSRGNINLNYKLLLLPPEWTRYVIIHELCHTVEMNHSKAFWQRVEQHMPDYESIHEAMKNAMQQLPVWVNYPD